MRNNLVDIVKNTHGLGVIELVKIVGSADETLVEALSEDRSVIVKAKFNNPIPEFIGTFGMPNLNKLNTILKIQEYAEAAKITLSTRNKDGVSMPAGLHFENAAGDFENDYRFMTQEQVTEKLRSVKFKGVKWSVEFSPTAANITRFKAQSSANSEETTFIAKTDGTDLRFFFGDDSTHAGNFVFQSGITGSLTKGWTWPVSAFLSILTLAGDKTVRISDEGAAQITVDTGLATYEYILPAQGK